MAVTTKINVPHPQIREPLLKQWQSMLDVLAEFMDVPVALIMHLKRDALSVFAKNTSPLNPYHVGDSEKCTGSGLYCEHVIHHNSRLFVHNAQDGPKWQNNPDLELNLLNYLGFPLRWPNGDIFGTVCVLDSQPHIYSEKQERLMLQMRDMVETNLELLEKNLELENLSKNLQYLANTDELTGVWNRRAFIAESNKELQRAQRNQRPVCLLMMDLDDFKDINDEFGHEIGDEVLKLFTHSIRANKRSYDIFGRIGGEEFAMLLPETSKVEAIELAERIRRKVSEIFFHTQGNEVKITVSIGVYELASNDTTLLAALSQADKILYAAKRAGKNQVKDQVL
jgi:diguanylate cyclase (GGDEF)-like protein